MENQLQISNSEQYFLKKKESVNDTLQLSNKSFLQKSYSFVKLIELKKDANFVFLIGGWIAQTSALMQIKNPVDNFTKQDIVNMLGGYWSNLGLEDLIKAFELERFGMYEEKTEHFQLFDCNYIAQVLKKYQSWSRRKKMEYNLSNHSEKKELTEAEKHEIMKNAINSKYKEFIETKKINGNYTHFFDFLVSIEKIKVPKSKEDARLQIYYNNIYDQAKNIVLEDLKNNKVETKVERDKIKNMLDDVTKNVYRNDFEAKVISKAKSIVIEQFFEKQLSLNKTEIL